MPGEELTDVGRGITLCHESFGSPDDPPLLLIMGLGTQMIAWHDDFCRELAERGFHVVRFDNRDAGRSTHVGGPVPGLKELITRKLPDEAYSLDDMSDDAGRLIEALNLGPTHVVGASMGGMLGQMLAVRRPDLVLSLCSIMSNTGSRLTGQPALGAYRYLLGAAPIDREGFVDYTVRLFRAVGSRGLEFDEERLREMAARSFDRDHSPDGTGRQLGAITKTGERTKLLRRIEVPTVVIHGTDDRLVRPSGGRATAKAIPGARLVEVKGMGHDLPAQAWPEIIEAIALNASRAADFAPAAGATLAA
ncbi:alpha/beta hydrolase [soil metagenome]